MIIQWVSLTIWWSGDHSLMNILHTRGRHLWALWDMSTFDKINDGSISIIFQWSAISSLPFSKPALQACWNLSQLSLCQGKYSDLTLFTWWKKLQRLLEQIYCWSILNATQNATAKLCRWSPKHLPYHPLKNLEPEVRETTLLYLPTVTPTKILLVFLTKKGSVAHWV